MVGPVPQASVILATGRVFDVLDVPAPAGSIALAGMEPGQASRRARSPPSAGDRALFFVATRGAPDGRGRVVVLPSGLRARDRSPSSPRAALALPGQLCPRPAVRAARRRARPAGCARPAGARCPTRLRCSSCWPTPARRLRSSDAGDGPDGVRRVRPTLCTSSGLRACRPGGVNSPVRAFGAVGGTPGVHGVGARAVPDRRRRQPLRRPGLLLGADDPRPRASRR